MATAALLAAKPFTSVANSISPLTGFCVNNNNIVLAHTGNTIVTGENKAMQYITKLKKNHANLLMLHAGDKMPVNQAAYDASMHSGASCNVAVGDYKIIYKGDIKTG